MSATFRLTLVGEQDGEVIFERVGIARETVRDVADACREVLPVVQAARGAHTVYRGIREAMEGLGALGVLGAPGPRRKKVKAARR